ncbi:MAG: hypothetical protein J6J26_06700 [Bacteroides sp.]|nr:hypothetical protein [Bacteroides sp.]
MKKIKFLGMLVVAMVMSVQVMNAQEAPKGPHKGMKMTPEKMAEFQANRLSNELGLDDATSAKFVEVYQKYMKALGEVHMEFANKFKKANAEITKEGNIMKPGFKSLTDAQVDQMMKDRFAISRKTLDVREKYYDEFRKFLSPKQVQKIYDEGFMNRGKFQNEMNRRKGMKHPGQEQHSPMPR